MDMIYRDTPVGFHRLNPGGLDDREVFASNEALFYYINNETAYHGQRVLVKYDCYDQNITLKKGTSGKLIPIMEMPTGYEFISKVVNGKIYGLVFYFNDTDIPALDSNDYKICFDKCFFFSMMHQAGLLANSDTAINFMLEVNNDDAAYLTQGNPVTTKSSESSRSIMDRVKENCRAGNIVRLWVECTDYYKAMGV